MFTAQLAPLPIERIAVAEIGWLAEDVDMAIFFDPSHLAVIGNVAPYEVVAGSVPGWPFGPAISCRDTFDGCRADPIFIEFLFQRNDIGIGVSYRLTARPIAGCGGLPLGGEEREGRPDLPPALSLARAGSISVARKREDSSTRLYADGRDDGPHHTLCPLHERRVRTIEIHCGRYVVALMCSVSAIQHQNGACEKRGIVARQVCEKSSYFFGLCNPANGVIAAQHLPKCFLVAGGLR